MSFLEALILGIIQGLTEFLPVSSSGHIEIGKVLLDVHLKDNLLFSVIVHAATALSTIVVFWKDIARLLIDSLKFKWNDSTKFIAMIALSMIPVGIVGVFFEDQVEELFEGQLLLVGSMLIVTAILLFLTTIVKPQDGKVNFWKALIVGIAQAIAVLPGISRSGATISTSLLLGIERERAARFSFLMVLPPILGATLLKLKGFFEAPPEVQEISFGVLGIGFVAAFISGVLACRWMILLVKKSKLIYFAIYCAVVGAIAIIAYI